MLGILLITISLLSQITIVLIVGCGKKNKKKEEAKCLGVVPDDKNLVTAIAEGKSAKSHAPSKAASVAVAIPEKKNSKKDSKKDGKEPDHKPSADGTPSKPSTETPGAGEKKDAKEAKKDEKKEEKKEEEEKKKDDDNASTKNRPYPEVKDPTPSEIEKKKKALEKEKAEKIANGDYQKKSDEDDTLEKVVSLKEEQTEKLKK